MFQAIIESLINSGMTQYEIAAEVRSSQASINRIRKGLQRPGYDLGAALIALHDEKLGEQKAAA